MIAARRSAVSDQLERASLVLQTSDALRFKPATRVENACATGSAAVHQGINAIDAKTSAELLALVDGRHHRFLAEMGAELGGLQQAGILRVFGNLIVSMNPRNFLDQINFAL